MELKNKKFIVTGGAGFIGSHVVDQLILAGAREILILDDLSRGTRSNIEIALGKEGVYFEKIDIRSASAIEPFFKGADGCFHMAALRITQCASEPRKALEIMIDGTYNVLEACLKHSVSKVVFSSSASVYGMANIFPTNESHHPWNNKTWYGAAKLTGEGMLRSFYEMFGLSYAALRYFNVYGPRMDIYGKYTEVLIRWIDAIENGEKPKIFGDGKQTVDLIYVEDVARANLCAMRSDQVDSVFNIASGMEISLLQLLDCIIDVMGDKIIKPEFLPERKVNPVTRRLADINKARRDISFDPQVSLRDGLKKLVDWRKTQQFERVVK